MWLIFLLIIFGYSLGLDAFSVLRKVCPIPPIVSFDPTELEKKVFCSKCPHFTTTISMGLPMKSTADFMIEYTLKVENLWFAVYHSFQCEPHSKNYGGYIIFNEEGKMLRAESGHPGLCQNLSNNDILCLNHFMAQGVLNTWISHCKLTHKYRLSCKDVFVAKDDTAFSEERGEVQYISGMYIKNKDYFYFEVNQEGKRYPIHCQRQGNIFKCKGLKKLKRGVP